MKPIVSCSICKCSFCWDIAQIIQGFDCFKCFKVISSILARALPSNPMPILDNEIDKIFRGEMQTIALLLNVCDKF